MKLQVQNLGPIKFGEVDLSKRFYVFVGYNNSGKTYMGQLMWTLFSRENLNVLLREKIVKLIFFKEATLDKKFTITKDLIFEILDEFKLFFLEKFIENLNINKEHFLYRDFIIEIDNDKVFEEVLKTKKEVILGFNTKNSYVQILVNDNKPEKKYNFKEEIFLMNKNENSLDIHFTLNNKLTAQWSMSDMERTEYESGKIAEYVFELVISCENLNNNLFFLPANRNFYPNFYKYIYSASKEEKDAIGREIGNGANLERIKTLAKRPYTQPMDELNKRVFQLNNHKKPTGYYVDLLEELEEIIGGKIEVVSVEGIAPVEFRLKIGEDKFLDMHVASSSSNQLTTLYLYLKYWAAVGRNFLIIDEPEENLHPQNQIKLLELLIKFSKRNNNRILITTHSTLLSNAINNHLNLGHLKKEGFDLESISKEKNLHIDVDSALEPDETGVYFFNGERIFEYDMNDYGVVFRDFVEEEKKVRDDGSELKSLIYNHLKDKRRQKVGKIIEERKGNLEQAENV